MDFAKTTRYDPWALLREQWVLDLAEETEELRLRELAYQWHCNAAQLVAWDQEETHFNYHLGQARDEYENMGRIRLSWYDEWWQQRSTVVDAWEQHKAGWKNPAVQAHMRELQKGLDHIAAEDVKRAKANVEWARKRKAAATQRLAQKGRRKR